MELIGKRSAMDRCKVVGNAILVQCEGLLDSLCGCSHRRTTFPMTLRSGDTVDGRPGTHSETYIVCVECGRKFAYDWNAMRLVKQRGARARTVELVVNGPQLVARPAVEPRWANGRR